MKAEHDSWRNRYSEIIETVMFPYFAGWTIASRSGWLPEPEIGLSPHLGPRALEKWCTYITHSQTYLEYGAGGSTVEAVQKVPHVITVETDRCFLEAVKHKVATVSAKCEFHPIDVDIGWTTRWGRPLITWGSQERVSKWRAYPAAPWKVLRRLDLLPDLIFVDGRFRVACVLESFLRLPDDSTCRFMLDDFKYRGRMYGPVLDFAENVEEYDRMIVFSRKRSFDRSSCKKTLIRHYTDPR